VTKISIIFLGIAIFISGCNLSGDFTPPPALATFQASSPTVQPTASPLPTPTTVAETVERVQDALEDVVTEGSIRGVVRNGSEGGHLPDVIEVNLYGFDDQQEAFSETTIANENGQYQFSGFGILPGRVFVTTVEYQGTIYASEVAHFIEETELDLPITIFESTPDLSNLQVDRMHVIIDLPSEGLLQVTELWILSNLGDRTISSEAGDGILAVELPDGAANLSFESGMLGTRFQVTAGGFIDLYPIRPGDSSHEIVFSFNMPFDKSLDFSQPIPYPVEAVVLLTPEGVVALEGEGVQDVGVRQMTGMTLHNYSKEPISPGDVLAFVIKRESGSEKAFDGSDSMLELTLGVLIFMAALGGAGFWLYHRKKENEVDLNESLWSEGHIPNLEAMDDQDEIFQTIADLDDAYETKEISYANYQKRRNILKKRLVETMKQGGND
jgi:hypothetical protein